MTNKEGDQHRNRQTNIRLSDHDRALLEALTEDYGLSMNDVVMLLVRAEARRKGISPR